MIVPQKFFGILKDILEDILSKTLSGGDGAGVQPILVALYQAIKARPAASADSSLGCSFAVLNAVQEICCGCTPLISITLTENADAGVQPILVALYQAIEARLAMQYLMQYMKTDAAAHC